MQRARRSPFEQVRSQLRTGAGGLLTGLALVLALAPCWASAAPGPGPAGTPRLGPRPVRSFGAPFVPPRLRRTDARASGQRGLLRGRTLAPSGGLLAPHRDKVAALDELVDRLHGARSGGVRIQLTGSTLYDTVAGIDRGTQPTFADVDLRIAGAPAQVVLATVRQVFPQVKAADIEWAPSYAEGVEHVQVMVPSPRGPPMQLDLSIYERGAEELDKPHQWVSFAKLKLEVPEGVSLGRLLEDASRRESAVGLSALKDPSRRGIQDLVDRRLRVSVEPGMPRARLPEGLLHALYLVGKRDLAVAPETERLYRRLPARAFRRFFDARLAGRELAAVRARYVLSAFRANRNVERALDLGRRTGFWAKLFPSLRAPLSDETTWRSMLETMREAQGEMLARAGGDGEEGRWTRAWLLGALLSPIADVAQVRRELARLRWGVTDEEAQQSVHHILDGYRWANARARTDATPALPDERPN